MRGTAGEARQLAGLLKGGDAARRELALARIGRLAAEACAGAPDSVAGRAARLGEPAEAGDSEGARAVLALPIRDGTILGALRISSRAAWRFAPEEKRFFRAIAARAATLLGADGDHEARLRQSLQTF